MRGAAFFATEDDAMLASMMKQAAIEGIGCV
jgi:hypothetical protein